MADWLQLLPTVVVVLTISYFVALLISVLLSPPPPATGASKTKTLGTDEADSVVAEPGSVKNESDSDDDDDWEGVESTELDELFTAATAFVAASAADRLSLKVSNEQQVLLFGYYKIATEGPCTTPQPSAFKITARAKWQAWQKLGAMPPEEAMHKYIDVVTELYPSWVAGACGFCEDQKSKEGNADARSNDTKGSNIDGACFQHFCI